MYNPKPFNIDNQEEIISFIKENSLATIISNNAEYPIASHIPLIVKEEKLVGHFAKANPHVSHLKKNPKILLIFSGANAYISSFAKDPEHLSILPTWDYQIVQAEGKLSFVDEEELTNILKDLMSLHEKKEPKALNMADYPQDVFRKKLKAIIGFEIVVEEWKACFRLNQNRTAKERENIKRHLKDNPDLVNAINKYNL